MPVVSIDVIDEVEVGYKYYIADTKNNLEYTIKAPQEVDVKFGTILIFKDVREGQLLTAVALIINIFLTLFFVVIIYIIFSNIY